MIGKGSKIKNAYDLNSAIQQFNEVVQQNSSTAEELSAGAEELASQSHSLQDAISFFITERKSEENTNLQALSTHPSPISAGRMEKRHAI